MPMRAQIYFTNLDTTATEWRVALYISTLQTDLVWYEKNNYEQTYHIINIIKYTHTNPHVAKPNNMLSATK